jgi:2-polyprenyl-3-methyl-5-hydroxy-6-metoxy-1,4-benzoquinol methylase
MLGKAYKSMNPDTVWHGVEINHDAAENAKENLDDAWVLNANDLKPNKTMLEKPYDAIIYGDVIEHLIDPVKSMPAHLELLKSGGEMIACIPNVQHWTVVKDLLQGNWDYRNAGLMDNTHLRFFTRKSIRKLLHKLQLTLVEQQRLSYENQAFAKRIDEKDEILDVLRLANQAAGLEFNEFDFRTFQYVVRAKKD